MNGIKQKQLQFYLILMLTDTDAIELANAASHTMK